MTDLTREPSDDEHTDSPEQSPRAKGRRNIYRKTKAQRDEDLKQLRIAQTTSIKALIGKIDRAYTEEKFLALLNNRMEIEDTTVQAYAISADVIDNEQAFHQAMLERLTYAHHSLTVLKTPWTTVKQTLKEACETTQASIN